MPDVYVTMFLAFAELYKHGGIYVDLTTYFVRPLPADLDGFVAGGQGAGSDGRDCSTPTTAGRRQWPFVMQVCRGGSAVCGYCDLDEGGGSCYSWAAMSLFFD